MDDRDLLVENINNSYINLNNCTIGGDSGYISESLVRNLRTTRNIELIYPLRRNQRNRLPPARLLWNSHRLRRRYKVEHCNRRLKSNPKVKIRNDKYMRIFK